jgi:hypothetical protein
VNIADKLEQEWDHAVAKLHHQAQAEPTFTPHESQPEEPVTTPQQPNVQQQAPKQQAAPQQPAWVVDVLHDLTGELRNNKLIARLAQTGRGKNLTDQQADRIVAIIADVEQAHAVVQQ